MAMALDLSSLEKFDPYSDPTTLSVRWKEWLRRFERFLVAMDIKDETRKRALLLYTAGNEVEKIFATLSDVGEDKDYKKAIEKLSAYFSPKKNLLFETHKFRQLKQMTEETIDQYCTRLRQQAIICEFSDSEHEIKIQLVEACLSSRVRRKAIQEDLTLADTLAYARTLEITDKAVKALEADNGNLCVSSNSVNLVYNQQGNSGAQSPSTRENSDHAKGVRQERTHEQQQSGKKVCYNCGDNYYAGHLSECRAKGKSCFACGKQNHFASMCRSSRGRNTSSKPSEKKGDFNIRSVTDKAEKSESSDEDSYVFTVPPPVEKKGTETASKVKTIPVVVEKTNIRMIVDTGATINILDTKAFNEIKKKNPSLHLQHSTHKIYAYMQSQPLPVLGKFEGLIESKQKMAVTVFHVVNGDGGSLLSYSTATELGIVKLNVNAVAQSGPAPYTDPREDHAEFGNESPPALKNKKPDSPIMSKLKQEYPTVFNGIGKLKDHEVHLHLKNDAKPVVQKPRKTPFHLRKQTEKKLKELENNDIIEFVPAGTPTPYVSNLVVAPKPHNSTEVRVCVDMRNVNPMIERERHVIPNVEELFEDMAGATKFSKVDLTAGFHQLVLDEESRSLTTFHTHNGLMRYKRLCFGVNSAPEQFQFAIQKTLQGLEGVRNIADDIIVWGKTQKEHDTRLEALMKRLFESNLTLNDSKCTFNVDSIWFYGYILSKDGISADKHKIEALVNMKVPKDVSQLRSFLGLATYCERFIPHLATITAPLREVTNKGVMWKWTNRHEQAFNKVKEEIAKDCTTAFYDPSKRTRVTVDASPVGLGAILSQFDINGNERIVAYASRSLSKVEQRYSQTEKEALGVVFGCEKFHIYLIGINFELDTDHKPLEVIYHPKAKPSARIERWALRLQQYQFTLRHRPGKTNPADVLSRQPLVTLEKNSIAEDYVNFLTNHSVPKSMSRQEIENVCRKGAEIQSLITAIRTGHWTGKPKRANSNNNIDLTPYQSIRNELTVSDNGIVLRGNRLVMPRKLRNQTLNIAHGQHQGIVKTKILLRTKVWWPGIDRQIETLISSCVQCQAANDSKNVEPLKMTTMPSKPWQVIHGDFCGPFPSGDYLLVLMDEHSRFPEVEIIRSPSTSVTIEKLEKIFSIHGFPIEFVSDNGPPFQGHDFQSYLATNGIKHRKITPYWPQANSHVERFMRTIEKSVRIAHSQGKNWKHDLYRFLLDYRTTPYATTGKAPADLLFNRQIRNRLPDHNAVIPEKNRVDAERGSESHQLDEVSEQGNRETVLQRDALEKSKMKVRADIRNHARESQLRIGDLVLMKQHQRNKLYLPWNPSPYRVTRVKGSQITAKRRGVTVTRNSSHFKRITPYMKDVDDPYFSNSEEEEEFGARFSEKENEIGYDVSDDDVDEEPREEEQARRYPRRENRDNRPRYYEEEHH